MLTRSCWPTVTTILERGIHYLSLTTTRVMGTQTRLTLLTLATQNSGQQRAAHTGADHFINSKLLSWLDECIYNQQMINRTEPGLILNKNVINCYSLLKCKLVELEGLEQLITETDSDSELHLLASTERHQCVDQASQLQQQLIRLVVPEEEHTEPFMMEITAGVGGQEAMLFAADLLQMYQRWIDKHNGIWDMMDMQRNGLGGVRNCTVMVSGEKAHSRLMFEGGIHRVQRVPRTEKSGRIHTSTAAVALLKQPQSCDIHIEPNDLQVQTMKSSGAGGQHVNTTDSAVRLIHLPTRTTVECQQGRSQIRNKELAMTILRSKLHQAQLDRQHNSQQQTRYTQVGSTARSDKIRTYNYPSDRITDHRLGTSVHNIDSFLSAGTSLEQLLDRLSDHYRQQCLINIISINK